MSTYEIIIQLCEKNGIAATALEAKLGFGRGSIGKLKKGGTSAKRLQQIADYFGVSLEYLLNGEEKAKPTDPELSAADERDISRDLERILDKLSTGEDGPASFDGTEIPEADREMFAGQLEIMLRRLKAINKELYNPNKNKK